MKPIPGFDDYFASEEGDIYSIKTGKLKKLNPGIQTSGKYYIVSLKVSSGKFMSQRVHRLVCIAYHGLPFEKATASHQDGNWKNNRPENLAWESYSDNLARRHEHGTDDTGIHNSRSKINLEQLIEIRKLLAQNELSHREIGLRFNVNRLFITKIANGYRYKGQGL